MNFLEPILKNIIEIINGTGYWGMGIVMAIQNACIPIPSEVVLPLGGNMAASNPNITLLGINIVAGAGSLVGSLIAYALGYYGGRPFILTYGKYFFMPKDHFLKAEETFNKHGLAAVCFGRFVPIIRSFISLPAGIAEMNIWKFILYSTIGIVPWNFILIWLGYVLGEHYKDVLEPIFKKLDYIVIGVVVFGLLAWWLKSYTDKKKNNNKKRL
jgi:membrane protein DedA with SNARE-associated domain